MRKMILSLVVGGGLVAAAVVPAFACMYNSVQASDQQRQQTAQAQPSDTKTQ